MCIIQHMLWRTCTTGFEFALRLDVHRSILHASVDQILHNSAWSDDAIHHVIAKSPQVPANNARLL